MHLDPSATDASGRQAGAGDLAARSVVRSLFIWEVSI